IRWRYTGASDVGVDQQGKLVVSLPPPANPLTDTETLSSTLIEQAPSAWQTIGEHEVAVPIHFVVARSGEVSFAVGTYDHTQPLIIDPTLSYSTGLGGNGTQVGQDIVVDSGGNAYIVGATTSSDFPTVNPPQPNPGGGDCGTTQSEPCYDAFVSKLNASGS